MTSAEDDAVIVFNCGGADSLAPFTVNISNLSLIKVS